MGDQLDFSKLLAWKLLLSISSLDDALEESYYETWDQKYGIKRKNTSYLNTSFSYNLEDEIADDLKAKNSELKKRKDKLTAEIKKLTKYIQTARTSSKGAKKTRIQNSAKTEKLTTDITDLEKDLKTLTAMAKELQKEHINIMKLPADATKLSTDEGRLKKLAAKFPAYYQQGGTVSESDKRRKEAELIKLEQEIKELEIKEPEKGIQDLENNEELKAKINKYKELTKEVKKIKLLASNTKKDQKKEAKSRREQAKQAAKEAKQAAKAMPTKAMPTKAVPTPAEKAAKAERDKKATNAQKNIVNTLGKKAPVAHSIITNASSATAPMLHGANQRITKTNNDISSGITAAHSKITAAHSKITDAHSNIRNSKHGSGLEFQKKQEESNNLIYLENAIDDTTSDPIDFSSREYKKFGEQPEFLSSLENILRDKNPDIVTILNEMYDTLDPLTLTYLNKLIATSIPLIDRLKLYIFIASLMPELSDAFVEFLESIKVNNDLLGNYTKELNNNMKGLFFKNNKKITEIRDKAKEQPNMMESMLAFGKKKNNDNNQGYRKIKIKKKK